ncbi:MAG: hypothetical protein KDC34_11155 [Saprospiraceae bacterium]|nr:hypothetical protein [Saprospiraceae bacterium]
MKMNKPIHDYTKGSTAKFLEDLLGIEFSVFSTAQLEFIKDVPFSEIKMIDGYAIYTDNGDEYLMFAYLSKYKTKRWGSLPKFHTVECKTKLGFSNFSFSNKMPVDIYSKDEQKLLKDQYLRMCGNCKHEHMKSFWGRFSNIEWYDAVLEYARNRKIIVKRTDEYTAQWKQISTAYREKKGWQCEGCLILLKNLPDRKFLHVHHRNGKKSDNREENFQSLCILCHAFEHLDKVKQRKGFIQLDEFVSLKYEELKRLKNKYLNEWLTIKNDYFRNV